ncbi:MAG TPA: HD domain-containing protein [Candidatus Enterocloster excrementipullorum]|uniref:HD domain-containing protein n=1 Tax=Candidatus Enterocloster excrementipullorum TaxID=2838559 RepID=A0A9D2SJ75_9FIRM|nr:HD domain-containing protein [Candidatus Enterocloster excrementipullorum]
MVEEAAAFAAKAHEGAVRKGTNIPYITHPLETALIVSGFTSDEELIAASLLHDVVEDAGVSEEELRRRFGSRVSGLVMQASEDKSKSWQERKSTALSRLKEGSWDLKVLAMGDKLSNMRCTARDYMIIGDALWERFNEKRKHRQGWYYWGIAQALRDLQDHIYYREYIMLCTAVFGKPED